MLTNRYPLKSIGDLAEVVTKGTTPTTLGYDYTQNGVPFIRVNNLVSRYVDHQKNVLFIGEETNKALSRSVIQPGDVLIAIAGTIGRVSIVPDDAPPLNCNQAVCIVRCTPEIDRKYLSYWLESDAAIRQITSSKVVGVISNLSLTQVKGLKIPLPPLPEQRRIAAILDKADALRAKRREAIAKCDQLLQSVFLEMFGDPVTNPRGWPMSTIGDECLVGTGSTPSRKDAENYHGSIPWVKSTEVDWGVIRSTSECVSESGREAARLKMFDEGSVIVALYGQGKTRGKCAILGMPATLNQACAAITPSEKVSTQFLFAFLTISYLRLRGEARGGNQENLNLSILKSFKIPVPDKSMQERFNATTKSIAGALQQHSESLTQSNQLFNSLQQSAFSGHLSQAA